MEKIQQAADDAQEKEGALQLANDAAKEAKNALTALEQQEQAWRQQTETLRDADTLLAIWRGKRQEADAISADVTAAKELQRETDAQRTKAAQAQQAYVDANERYLLKNEEYIATQTAFLDAQAGLLAREKLRPGLPCPVCGSLEHPAPCALSEAHQDLTRERIDALANAVAEFQKDQQDKAGAAGTAAELLQ